MALINLVLGHGSTSDNDGPSSSSESTSADGDCPPCDCTGGAGNTGGSGGVPYKPRFCIPDERKYISERIYYSLKFIFVIPVLFRPSLMK